MGNKCAGLSERSDATTSQIIETTSTTIHGNNSIFEQNEDFNLKMVLLGNSSVGKTSILYKLVESRFSDTHSSTIGVDYKKMDFNIDGKKVHIQLWDTAGQERFKSIVLSYYRGAHGALFIYDITDKETLSDISTRWLIDLRGNNEHARVGLIGNKTDLKDARAISTEQGKKFSEEIHADLFEEISAKDISQENLSKIFEKMIRSVQELDWCSIGQQGFRTKFGDFGAMLGW
jgi:small GTP-binding protein